MKNKGLKRFLELVFICLTLAIVNQADIISIDKNSDYSLTYDSAIRNPEANIIKTAQVSFSMPESQCRIPRQTNFTSSIRTLTQAHRNSQNNQSRNGYILIKAGKSMNEYTTSLFFSSIINFPSGMNESNHHLISLRKLII